MSVRLQQIRQCDEILVAKTGTSSTDRYERIDSSGIRAIRQDRLQTTFGVVEVHAILAPVVSVLDEVEFLPGQWMEGVGYAETFVRTVLIRCI